MTGKSMLPSYNANDSNDYHLWYCVYCGENFESKAILKLHFSKHRLHDKVNRVSTMGKSCPCGKHFSEFHYFENHLLQTGHMNDSHLIKPPLEQQLCQNSIKLRCHSPLHFSATGMVSEASSELSNEQELSFLKSTSIVGHSSIIQSLSSSHTADVYIFGATREFSTGKC